VVRENQVWNEGGREHSVTMERDAESVEEETGGGRATETTRVSIRMEERGRKTGK
jgi:hypothetical protein